MRAQNVLQPSEREQFRFVVFGGILGDHPPQDRAKDFRETFSHIRQLGTVQMTTDTAVLVSHAILGEQKPFESLQFVDEPSIPMEDNVNHFLDISMPHDKIAQIPDSITDFKTQIVDNQLRQEARVVIETINESQGEEQAQEVAEQDAMVEMTTIMEGFRYMKNDNSLYPILKGAKPCTDFPVIPIGMLSIWRE